MAGGIQYMDRSIETRDAHIDVINLGSTAAVLELAQKSHHYGERFRRTLAKPEKRGNHLLVEVANDGMYAAELREDFLPVGSKSRVDTTRRVGEISRTRSANVEVEGIREDDDMQVQLILKLLTKSPIFLDTENGDSLRLVRPKRTLYQEYLAKLNEVRQNKTPYAPLENLLSGRFPELPESLPEKEGLDEAQQRAYGIAMSGYPNLFVQGPPGTGKTRVITEIAKEKALQGQRVLILSHSNKAIDVPGVKLIEQNIPVSRGGTDWTVVAPELRRHRIRYKANWPKEELNRIDNLTPAQVLEEAQKRGIECTGSSVIARQKLKELVRERAEAKAKEAELRFADKLPDGGRIVTSTFDSLVHDRAILDNGPYDVVIIDEATRAKTHHMMMAASLASRQLIMVGDPEQLGPIPYSPNKRVELEQRMFRELQKNLGEVRRLDRDPEIQGVQTEVQSNIAGQNLSEWAERDLTTYMGDQNWEEVKEMLQAAIRAVDIHERGFFTSLLEGTEDLETELPYVFLDQGRRSLPAITRLVSEFTYDGKLQVARESDEVLGDGAVQWIDTKNLGGHETTRGTSKKNGLEADIIVQMVLDRVLNKNREARTNPEDLAIIATYKHQAEMIADRLRRRLGRNERLYKALETRIGTVDAFQGDEAKTVLVSMTRSNEEGRVGFLAEGRRLNVMISRPCDELVVVADSGTLVGDDPEDESREIFRRLHAGFERHGEVIEPPKVHHPRKKRSRGRKREAAKRRRRAARAAA